MTLRLASFLSCAVLLVLTGCSSGPASSSDGGSAQMDCTSLPKTQPASAPCCPSYGVDACGANLFCAAYDGRTQASCYAEHSRADMTQCSGDSECLSNSCNSTTKLCRSQPKAACDPATGCVSLDSNDTFVCISPEHTCEAVGPHGGDACTQDSDCNSQQCDLTRNRCLSELSEMCSWGGVTCPQQSNAPCSDGDKNCAKGHCYSAHQSNIGWFGLCNTP